MVIRHVYGSSFVGDSLLEDGVGKGCSLENFTLFLSQPIHCTMVVNVTMTVRGFSSCRWYKLLDRKRQNSRNSLIVNRLRR